MNNKYSLLLLPAVSLLTLSACLFNLYVAKKMEFRSKEALSRTLNNNLKEKAKVLKASIPGLLEKMKTCSEFGCLMAQLDYYDKSGQLDLAYQELNCESGRKYLSQINNYMTARFVIAKRLPLHKKQQLDKLQKDYYSVVIAEAQELKENCPM